jgi:hypothetical protein
MLKFYTTLYEQDLTKYQYTRFLEWCNSTHYGEKLYEGILPKWLEEVIDNIKQFASETGLKLKDLIMMFMDKTVFKFFSLIKWSFTKLFDLMKQGYKIYKDLIAAVTKFIHDNKIVEWTADKIKLFDEFLKRHPTLKRVAGIAVFALLIYIWHTMAFTGKFVEDFDLSIAFDALKGNYDLTDIFTTPAGIEMLGLFATGALTSLSFPWPSGPVKFAIAILTTLAKKLKKRLSYQ